MKTSRRSRFLAALLGALTFAPFARADALADAHAALAAGDFATMQSILDPFIIANPTSDDARVLRAIARFGLAAEADFPAFLRTRLGANVATLDISDTDLALRFPRPFGYFTTPGFTSVGSGFYQYDPAINLYESEGTQPSLSFENGGTTPYSLTLTVSQPGATSFNFDTTLYLDGILLGYANALGGFPFEVFIPSLFELGGDIPEPFDLQGSVPEFYLSDGPVANSLTVTIPPKSNFTIGIQASSGNLRFTPSDPLPSSVVVRNGRAGGITQPVIARTANFSDFVQFAVDLDNTRIAPAVADLEAVSTEIALILPSDETGHAADIVIGYPDVQLLLAELKFLQAFRRLSTSYKFSQPLTLAMFDNDFFASLTKNPAFLTPQPASASRAGDRALAKSLLLAACDHYTAASEAGLWTRAEPLSGTYLFAIPTEEETMTDGASEEEDLDLTIEQGVDAFFAGLYELVDSQSYFPIGEAEESAISLAPLFGTPVVNVRKLLPVSTENGIVRGTSTELLTRGFITGVGTGNWESFLEDSELLDLVTPAVQTAPKIQRQPAALTTVEEGESATLSVLAECYPAPTYQWYRDFGGAAVAIEGTTGPNLPFESVSRDDAGIYTVRVTNTRQLSRAVTTTVTSIRARLYVTYAPEIVTPPEDIARYNGRSVTLTVEAVGVPAPRYQWFLGEAPVTTLRTSPSYTFTASAARAGDYRVVITNARGEITSDPITVDVQTKPVFTVAPVSQTVRVGDSVTFTATATGNPAPALKWRKNGRDIPGATGPTYTLESVTLADRAIYTAVAFSLVNTSPTATTTAITTSKSARLTVNP